MTTLIRTPVDGGLTLKFNSTISIPYIYIPYLLKQNSAPNVPVTVLLESFFDQPNCNSLQAWLQVMQFDEELYLLSRFFLENPICESKTVSCDRATN